MSKHATFWRDKTGKIIIAQRPNWAIIGWLVTSALYWTNLITALNRTFFGIATVFLTIWALQELLQGVNYFRRTLGAVVLIFTIMSLSTILRIVF